MKNALITGISGQDGLFLAKLLIEKDYRVFGFSRHEPASLAGQVEVIIGDITHEADILNAVERVVPDEIYNLASQSRPGESWIEPARTLNINGLGALNLFEAVRQICPESRVCHASSSELFGQVNSAPQNEHTPFNPISPYGTSKLYAHHMAQIYREFHHLFISNAILFNHESEGRPLSFVTQKIVYGAACTALGILNSPDNNEKGRPIVFEGKLALGNLDISRDWGYAPDYVRAMWLMLQFDTAEDFVIGTGRIHTLRYLCDVAYGYIGASFQDHIISDDAFFRPTEPGEIRADYAKAHRELGWTPSVSFESMIQKMVDSQIERLSTFNYQSGSG